MKKFDIVIDLAVEAENFDDIAVSIPDYGNLHVEQGVKRSGASYFDITLSNNVEAETAEDAAATINEKLIQAFNVVDPDWHAIIFQDDDEKIQLYHGVMHRFDEVGYLESDVDLNKEFKCCECGTKYAHSFCATDNVAICRWCSGEESESGILA